MTATSTTPDFRPTTGYNDPPEDIFYSIKGKERATTLNDLEDEEQVADGMQRSAQQNRNILNGRKPPKQPRSRRMNNASLSSTKHVRAGSRASSNTEDTETNDVGIADTSGNPKNRYPAHSSIPTASNERPSPSLGHISERFDREIHALEHEIEDTLFRGSEADKRKHGLTREESRESLTKYHPEDQSMDMDVSIDEETLRRLRRARYLRSAAVTGIFVLLWYIFATMLSVYNKWMFSPQYYGFQYPLFVTCTHMIVQFCLATVVREVWSDRFKPKERPGRQDYIKGVIPTAVATGIDIGLSNLSLKTITLTLYTMCKSSALIFVLGFAFLFKLEAYSLRLVCVIAFISFGVFLMVFNATTVSIPGIIMVFSASALGGLRWALTQLVMHKQEMGMTNPFATIYWLTPVMAVTLAVVSIIFEGWFNVFGSDYFSGWKALETMGYIVFPGALAFSMVASEYCIIQRAGIVPLSIAGIFKEVSTITVSAWVFGDELTKLNILGVVVTICGIATYSYHKYQTSMELPPKHHLPQDPLLPTSQMDVPSRDRRYDEEDQENAYHLTNQHHVIGDSDEEVERIDIDVLAEGKLSRPSGEERQELLRDVDPQHR
ncbi:hypothetical protein NCC49_000446 [Naganishia albida]|nr:hypothetical protein NCC49_000446 [Naganishia albida]